MNALASHPSDSVEQRQGEAEILRALATELSFPVAPDVIRFPDGSCVNVDGVNRDHRFACEIFCRIGKLLPAQEKKLASDILKLVLIERILTGDWRKVLCLADEAAASVFRGRSWLATATSTFGIEVRVFVLPQETHDAVVQAQRRQIMVNKRDGYG